MSMKQKTQISPRRGEIWWVNFNSPASAPTPRDGTPKKRLPTEGDEIYKTRPAIVMNIAAHWNRKLNIVVPITGWLDEYTRRNYFWMIKIPKDNSNNLSKDSAAATFEIKSLSLKRFRSKLGVVSQSQLDLIAQTIAYNIGYVTSGT